MSNRAELRRDAKMKRGKPARERKHKQNFFTQMDQVKKHARIKAQHEAAHARALARKSK